MVPPNGQLGGVDGPGGGITAGRGPLSIDPIGHCLSVGPYGPPGCRPKDLVPAHGPAYRQDMGHVLLDGPLGGLIDIALATLLLGVTIGGVLYHQEVVDGFRRLAHRVSPPPEPPSGPPIERIARDVRRLRAELLATAPDTPMARRIGVRQAYDDLLVDACRALDVPDTLSGMPSGTERDAERLRVEHELEAAGLRLRP